VSTLSENWLGGFRVVDDGRTSVATYYWDPGSLSWVVGTQPGGGGGGSTVITTAAKGATLAGSPTSENTDANTQSLHTRITNASLAVTGTFFQATQPVSIAGSVAVTGPLTDAQLRATAVPVSFAATAGSKALNVQVVGADLGVITNSVIHALTSAGGGTYVDVKATPSGALVTAPASPTANARTSVAGAAVDTLILASNTSRLGATVFNDSTAILYLALGTAAASLTDYTVQMVAKAYYEVPYNYTGQIRGIWASATGSARIGELT